MAKESIKARERKRAKMVARYAAKRAALKEIVRTGSPEEVEQAVIALQKLPKNSCPVRMHNRCQLTGIRRVICASSASLVSTSVRWLSAVLSLV